uniref:Ribonuclease H1 N-terminal domain-containing protein n=1 Tax=Quercus lobata TaxID=97700 RepID=A0A7N2R846_QUELO
MVLPPSALQLQPTHYRERDGAPPHTPTPVRGPPHTPTSDAAVFPSAPESFLPCLLLSHSDLTFAHLELCIIVLELGLLHYYDVEWVHTVLYCSLCFEGKTYVMFVGRVPGVYDTWEEARAKVHQYFVANHKVFKHKLDAELAFMKFWQIEGGNVQQGTSSSTPSIEDSSSTEDVKYDLLKYQLDITIEQRNYAMKITKLNARILNVVASQVRPNDELNKMAHLTWVNDHKSCVRVVIFVFGWDFEMM